MRAMAGDEPVDAAIARKEQAAFVRQAIDQLPESYRSVLILRDLEELSTDEAARMLNLTPNAVKIRLHRARLALRTILRSPPNSIAISPAARAAVSS